MQKSSKKKFTIHQSGFLIQDMWKDANSSAVVAFKPLNMNIDYDSYKMFYCKGSFHCYQCNYSNTWGSSLVAIEIGFSFSYVVSTNQILETSDISGFSCFDSDSKSSNEERLMCQFSLRAFKQDCIECGSECKPKFNKKNIEYLFLTIENLIQDEQGIADPQVFSSAPTFSRKHHKKSLCEACRLGKCAPKLKKYKRPRKYMARRK